MSRRRTVEQRYPTASARAKADEAIDALPDETTLGEARRVWCAAYEAAGGKVRL